ncbi:MAG: hypothetical protein RLZZ203_15, partial [Cyanobacteriota bacterium]
MALAIRFLFFALEGDSVPKHIRLISFLVACSLWSMTETAHAQAFIPHTVQIDNAQLEKQGLSLAQEAAQLAKFQQVEPALVRAQLAAKLAPQNDKVWWLLGSLYLQNKEFDQAIISLNKAQTLNGKNPEVLFALGSAKFQKKDYQASINHYQAGLKLKPNYAGGFFDLGNAYYMLQKFPEAIAQFNLAVNQDKK